MKPQLLIIFIFCLFSCNTKKQLFENKKANGNRLTTITETKRKSLETTLELPKINFKDTTIYTVNTIDKTILKTTFDQNGKQTINCLPAEINERLKRIEENYNYKSEKELEKEFRFNPQYLIYGIAFLVLVVLVFLVFLWFVFSKIQKSMSLLK